MIIVFNGNTEDLLESLKRFSGATQKVTLDFMLENFKILTKEHKVVLMKQFSEKAVELFHESLKSDKKFKDVADEIAEFAYNAFSNLMEIPEDNKKNDADK